MGRIIDATLDEIESVLDDGPSAEGVAGILERLGGGRLPIPVLEEAALYHEFLPMSDELPYNPRLRYMHFLWDAFDKLPAAAIANLGIPLRRAIATRLFKRCGKNFIAEEGLRFNFANNLEIGDNVFFNRGCFIDAKGGVIIGNGVGFAEGVNIFTHNHSESDHMVRQYKAVVFQDNVLVGASAIILPGVTVGAEAFIGAGSVVGSDVESGMLVTGAPARPARSTRREGHHGAELNHYWLNRKAFQED